MNSTSVLTCPYCESEFVPVNSQHKYCSGRCQHNDYAAKNRNKWKSSREPRDKEARKCQKCGVVFETNHTKKIFCSVKCQRSSTARKRQPYIKAVPTSKHCAYCGEFIEEATGITFRVCQKCKTFRNKQRLAKYNHAADIEDSLTREQWEETLDGTDGKCVYCGDPWEHKDHFLPVSLGGKTEVNNMVPSCSKCNVDKGGLHPFDYIRMILQRKVLQEDGLYN